MARITSSSGSALTVSSGAESSPMMTSVARVKEQVMKPSTMLPSISARSMTEDLQREPDGIPHAVVGFTAMYCVVIAMLSATMFSTGTVSGSIGVAVLVFVATPAIVASLTRRARLGRDRAHPSR
jgi:hypothetical protein